MIICRSCYWLFPFYIEGKIKATHTLVFSLNYRDNRLIFYNRYHLYLCIYVCVYVSIYLFVDLFKIVYTPVFSLFFLHSKKKRFDIIITKKYILCQIVKQQCDIILIKLFLKMYSHWSF